MPGKNLLVDACIARAAGSLDGNSEGKFSRQTLMAIQDNPGHRLVFNTALRAEWDKHASRFSTFVRVWMLQHRRTVFVPDDAFSTVVRVSALGLESVFDREAFLKDSHVTAGALASDGIILSNESRLRHYLTLLSIREERFSGIIWGNPREEGAECADWIARGAPEEPSRKIYS